MDWSAFAQSVTTLYDGLITALGHPEMASKATPIRVPDTEISLFTDAGGIWVKAILIESPESLAWQRTWRWIRLADSANQQVVFLALWSADGTRGLLVPFRNLARQIQSQHHLPGQHRSGGALYNSGRQQPDGVSARWRHPDGSNLHPISASGRCWWDRPSRPDTASAEASDVVKPLSAYAILIKACWLRDGERLGTSSADVKVNQSALVQFESSRWQTEPVPTSPDLLHGVCP